jgi:hypothetical protein
MEVLVAALGGEVHRHSVSDPLGRPVEAGFALLPDGSAVVEMAQASGLSLVAESERDAWSASTRGTGELIAAAAEAGGSPIVVTVGGSATTDGGAGAIEALKEAGLEAGDGLELHVVCDVRVPFEDAPRIFGPQKGADPAMVKRLERRLGELAESLPRDPRGEPMTGCAGGLSGGLWAAHGAKLLPGAPYVLDAIGFDALMRASAFVVTGEGSLDEQTLQGKIVGRHPLSPGRYHLPRNRGPQPPGALRGTHHRPGLRDGSDNARRTETRRDRFGRRTTAVKELGAAAATSRRRTPVPVRPSGASPRPRTPSAGSAGSRRRSGRSRSSSGWGRRPGCRRPARAPARAR